MRNETRSFFRKLIPWHENVSPTRIVSFGFLTVILLGAALLCLPISTRGGVSAPFLTALFTSTSAVCVTGLVLQDTMTYWSTFGQVVIMFLIQIGGLGFMSIACIFSFLLRRTIGLQQRLVMMQSLNLNDIAGVVRMMRHILIWTLMAEGTGAVILSIRFSQDFGIKKGIFKGIFHAVSAFCNAGFDLMGEQSPFISLTNYSGDFAVNMVVMSLIVLGGLGFFVWEDLYQKRCNEHKFLCLHLHTKMVLLITAVLVFGGALFFYVAEYSNPGTMKDMAPGQRVLASFFQSVTPRTAGFNSIDENSMRESSKIVTMLLMFVGGSPGSTAGGIKTVTAGLMLLNMVCVMRGKQNLSIFGRSIPREQALQAASVSMFGVLIIIVSTLIMAFVEKFSFLQLSFEAISAFATVGLTTGITPQLHPVSQLILILLMYFGRVGVLTLSIAIMMDLHHSSKIKYPESKVLVG